MKRVSIPCIKVIGSIATTLFADKEPSGNAYLTIRIQKKSTQMEGYWSIPIATALYLSSIYFLFARGSFLSVLSNWKWNLNETLIEQSQWTQNSIVHHGVNCALFSIGCFFAKVNSFLKEKFTQTENYAMIYSQSPGRRGFVCFTPHTPKHRSS